MTSKELIESILTYHLKNQKALYLAPTSQLKHEAVRYESIDSFTKYVGSEDYPAIKYNIRISGKQAAFLFSLMGKEKIQEVEINGVFITLAHPTYHTAAYGGFVGKKTDSSKHQLRISKHKSHF